MASKQEMQIKSKSLKEAKLCLGGLLVSIVLFFSPYSISKVFGQLGLWWFASWFVFRAATVVTITLKGHSRNVFQLTVALFVPLVLSIYFISGVSEFSLEQVMPLYSWWFLLKVAILAYFGWFGAEMLDKKYPFRGYLFAAAILFVLCLSSYYSISVEEDYNYDEVSSVFPDKESAFDNRQSGRYFLQYLIYCATVYASMFLRTFRTQ